MLNSVPIEDIGNVIIGGKLHTGYIIAIMTKKSGSQETTGTIRQMVKGFDTAREFYHPKYDASDSPTSLADNRVTLYWNANLQTDKNGKATMKLFNSDSAQKFLITVEGTANGKTISTSQIVGKTN